MRLENILSTFKLQRRYVDAQRNEGLDDGSDNDWDEEEFGVAIHDENVIETWTWTWKPFKLIDDCDCDYLSST